MRSDTAMLWRRSGATANNGYQRRAFPQLNVGVVGLAGLEPAASSLSAIEGPPLCKPAFSQVAADRQGRSNAFYAEAARSASASRK
jgi:hypothetical protein